MGTTQKHIAAKDHVTAQVLRSRSVCECVYIQMCVKINVSGAGVGGIFTYMEEQLQNKQRKCKP